MGSWAFYQEQNIAYSRFLSCCCVECQTGIKYNMLNKCINTSTVGILKAHKMKPIVSPSNKPIDISYPNKRRRLNSDC